MSRLRRLWSEESNKDTEDDTMITDNMTQAEVNIEGALLALSHIHPDELREHLSFDVDMFTVDQREAIYDAVNGVEYQSEVDEHLYIERVDTETAIAELAIETEIQVADVAIRFMDTSKKNSLTGSGAETIEEGVTFREQNDRLLVADPAIDKHYRTSFDRQQTDVRIYPMGNIRSYDIRNQRSVEVSKTWYGEVERVKTVLDIRDYDNHEKYTTAREMLPTKYFKTAWTPPHWENIITPPEEINQEEVDVDD